MRDHTILVTGGTGSFGVAFIGALLADPHGPQRIISVSRNASKRYDLEQRYPDPRLAVVPGDVRIWRDLELATHGQPPIDVIVHCAAEKHVPTAEKHEHYCWSTNVTGAEHVIALGRLVRARLVVGLSTDKACAPINVYGRSKAEAERELIHADTAGDTRFSLVRYGNVVGSSGSVVPLFIRQRSNGTITVTDRRMSRFFMPLVDGAEIDVVQEPGRCAVWSAVRLVQWTIAHARGGEIFVPRIPSATILDLASAIAPDATIVETGIRPGEKLDEDLIAESEGTRCYDCGDGVYALLPAHRTPLGSWIRVPPGFAYHSGQSPQPLRYEVRS